MTPGKVRELLNGCSLPAAVELVGERWAFLILAAALNGVRHFEQFQAELGIARNILASRLGRLVENGILLREPVAEDRRKVVYRLTAKGEALLPAMIALRQWGERWATGVPATPKLVDARDHRPVRAVGVLAEDGRVLGRGDMLWAGPGETGG